MTRTLGEVISFIGDEAKHKAGRAGATVAYLLGDGHQEDPPLGRIRRSEGAQLIGAAVVLLSLLYYLLLVSITEITIAARSRSSARRNNPR